MTLYDPWAEMVVAACAVATRNGSKLAHERLDDDDFHDPVLRDLFLVSPELPLPKSTDDGPETARIAEAAKLCRVRLAAVEKLCAERPVMDDSGGHYAHRVSAAALRRSTAALLGDGLALLEANRTAETAERIQAALSLLRSAA